MSTIRPPRLAGAPAMGASKTGDVYVQTQGADLTLLSIDEIEVPEKRERMPTPEGIKSMKQSLHAEGFLHPVGVKEIKETIPKAYRVVYGAHRVLACRELHDDALTKLDAAGGNGVSKELENEVGRWERVPAIVYPKSMSDKLCRRYEIAENLHRSDLTREQRKHLLAEYAKMLVKEHAEGGGGNATTSAGGGNVTTSRQGQRKLSDGGQLFVDWYKGAKVDKKQGSREWNEFKAASGIANSSDKCSVGEFEQFAEWLGKKGEEQAKVAAEAKAKSEADAAAKARQKRLDTLRAAAQAVLDHDAESAIFDVLRELLPDRKITVT